MSYSIGVMSIIMVLVKILQFFGENCINSSLLRGLGLDIKEYYALSHTIYIHIVMVVPLYDLNE